MKIQGTVEPAFSHPTPIPRAHLARLEPLSQIDHFLRMLPGFALGPPQTVICTHLHIKYVYTHVYNLVGFRLCSPRELGTHNPPASVLSAGITGVCTSKGFLGFAFVLSCLKRHSRVAGAIVSAEGGP